MNKLFLCRMYQWGVTSKHVEWIVASIMKTLQINKCKYFDCRSRGDGDKMPGGAEIQCK